MKEIARGVKLHNNWCLNNNNNNNKYNNINRKCFECQHHGHDQHRRHAHTSSRMMMMMTMMRGYVLFANDISYEVHVYQIYCISHLRRERKNESEGDKERESELVLLFVPNTSTRFHFRSFVISFMSFLSFNCFGRYTDKMSE